MPQTSVLGSVLYLLNTRCLQQPAQATVATIDIGTAIIAVGDSVEETIEIYKVQSTNIQIEHEMFN